jgi:hypothetical protein
LPARRLVAWVALALVVAGLLASSAPAAPVVNSLPEVLGTAKLGGQLQCNSGSWSGGVSKFYFTWVRNGVEIEGHIHSETPEYFLQKADEGDEIWCIVTAKGEGTEVRAESSNSKEFGVPPKKEKPEPEKLPEVSGAGEVGKELKCSPGTWKGSPTPTLSYRWLRDEQEIQGQTAPGYTVMPEDEGHKLACKVIAVNEAGEAFAISSNSITVPGHPPTPVDGQPPSVEGVGSVGETLTCLHGGWTGTQPITFSYQWLLEGAEISGATGQTLLVLASYEGKNVECRVTAKNSVNEAKAASAAFGIGEQTPENTTRPQITGEPEVGEKLKCSEGTWTGSPSNFKFTWHRVKSGVEEEIGTKQEYTVEATDVGNALYCTVKAENAAKKSGTAKSEAFVIPEAGKMSPKAKALPLIEGTAGAGDTLTCHTVEAEWEGSAPINFEYQWVREAGTANEVAIKEPEGTKPTYVVQGADEGHFLTCRVTARNAGGTGKAESVALEIPGRKPANTEAPSISPAGTAHPGETLTCLGGRWEGAPAPEYSYRWLSEGAETGVSGDVYKVASSDSGHTLSCVVTATNKYAPAGVKATSAGVYVPGGAPEPLEAPKISGNAQVNEEVVCEEGRWNGAPLEPSFQWMLNGVPIAGATQKNIRIPTAYRGELLACRVTEKNAQGSASAESPAKRVPGVPPRNVVPPTITGVGSLSAQLTCEHGLWEGAPPPSFSYQWYRDSTPITGATGSTYIIEPADEGHLLACVVTAANVENQSEAESANVVAVLKPKEPEGGHTATTTPQTTQQIITLLRNAFTSQLPQAFADMHLKSVRKRAGASFGFTSPRAGKFEIQWYITVKAAHGKHRRITLAAGTIVYAKPERRTMKIVLAKEGKRILKNVQHMKISAEAVFKVLSGPTVTWSDAFTLH